jgi:hypothetical protein
MWWFLWVALVAVLSVLAACVCASTTGDVLTTAGRARLPMQFKRNRWNHGHTSASVRADTVQTVGGRTGHGTLGTILDSMSNAYNAVPLLPHRKHRRTIPPPARKMGGRRRGASKNMASSQINKKNDECQNIQVDAGDAAVRSALPHTTL